MKLIDKNKLLEELKKLKQNLSASPIVVIGDVESLVESLEVKEVDLDFEQELYKTFGQVKDFTLGMRIAKHFYELGLNAKKGE